MAALKAPDPNSFAACFYQENWAFIGDEVCKAVTNFFTIGQMDREVNTTHIVLIPKKILP
jgi:hypothetical protein